MRGFGVSGLMRRSVLGAIGGAAGFVLTGCDFFGQGAKFRFRMTAEVNTAQGVRRGSSVYEVSASQDSFKLGDVSGNGVGLEGEATLVELPHDTLFILLALPKAGGPLESWATVALLPGATGGSGGLVDAVRQLGSADSPVKAELPRKHWPMMVRFGDPTDPRTVEMVEPDLFGVSRLLLETTHDAVTTGIRDKLPWLSGPGKRLVNGGGASLTRESPVYERLGQGLFKMGSWQ